MSLWSGLAGLKLLVDSVDLVPHTLAVSPQFERHTTVIRLGGAGTHGEGEEVSYDQVDQAAFRQAAIDWPRGEFDLESFSTALDTIDLFDRRPQQQANFDYRRWAVESAALDLALRQAGKTLPEVFERCPAPVRFVASTGLGQPPSLEPIERVTRRVSGMRFKLDANSGWSQEWVDRLAAMDLVDIVDLKGAYRGTPVDTPADAALYRRVAESLPATLLEDPAWTEETAHALEPYHQRISWDAPIHGVADIEALPFQPRVLNIKPSRFGKISKLCEAYEYCDRHGIAMYGGGQFELNVGRVQIQTLAAMFHADASNDVAPVDYHQAEAHERLPATPLTPRLSRGNAGFAIEWQ